MTDASAPNDVPSEHVAAFFSVSDSVRYVAIVLGGSLTSHERSDVRNRSESESDRYEELFVNPGLLGLASARGNLDCGGLEYLIVRYDLTEMASAPTTSWLSAEPRETLVFARSLAAPLTPCRAK